MGLEPKRECNTCRYWLLTEERVVQEDEDGRETQKNLGQCRYNPPTVLTDGSSVRTFEWPLLWEDEFCYRWYDKNKVSFLPDLG